MKIWLFTVSGKHGFPACMLCHDECWPTDMASAEIIVHSTDTEFRQDKGVGGNATTEFKVCLASIKPPSTRWKSFTWTVSNVRNDFLGISRKEKAK